MAVIAGSRAPRQANAGVFSGDTVLGETARMAGLPLMAEKPKPAVHGRLPHAAQSHFPFGPSLWPLFISRKFEYCYFKQK